MSQRPAYDDGRPHRIICERTWSEQTESLWLTVDDEHRALMVVSGRGTTEGARMLIDMVDQMQAELGHEIRVTVLADMRAVRGAPLRAQSLLLKRFITGRHQLAKAAFVVTNPFEVGVGRALLGLTGMGSKAQLCRQVPEAVHFLGWPHTRYRG